MNHCFNVNIAKNYGMECAVIIECLYMWIHRNECHDDMIMEGRVWCYSSAEALSRYLPYMNAQKVRRLLLKLEEAGIIVVGNFNKNVLNQTLWYAFSDEGVELLEKEGYDFSKMKNGIFKNEKSEYNIIEYNKKNNILSKQSLSKNYSEKENNKKEKTNEIDASFEYFWNAYGYKKSHSKALKVWERLNESDRRAAIEAIKPYFEDCQRCRRSKKHPTTYLNQRTWEDDFSCSDKSHAFDILPGDSEKEIAFKKRMADKFPELAMMDHPITFDGYVKMSENFGGYRVVEEGLRYLVENIYKYKHYDADLFIENWLQNGNAA